MEGAFVAKLPGIKLNQTVLGQYALEHTRKSPSLVPCNFKTPSPVSATERGLRYRNVVLSELLEVGS